MEGGTASVGNWKMQRKLVHSQIQADRRRAAQDLSYHRRVRPQWYRRDRLGSQPPVTSRFLGASAMHINTHNTAPCLNQLPCGPQNSCEIWWFSVLPRGPHKVWSKIITWGYQYTYFHGKGLHKQLRVLEVAGGIGPAHPEEEMTSGSIKGMTLMQSPPSGTCPHVDTPRNVLGNEFVAVNWVPLSVVTEGWITKLPDKRVSWGCPPGVRTESLRQLNLEPQRGTWAANPTLSTVLRPFSTYVPGHTRNSFTHTHLSKRKSHCTQLQLHSAGPALLKQRHFNRRLKITNRPSAIFV